MHPILNACFIAGTQLFVCAHHALPLTSHSHIGKDRRLFKQLQNNSFQTFVQFILIKQQLPLIELFPKCSQPVVNILPYFHRLWFFPVSVLHLSL